MEYVLQIFACVPFGMITLIGVPSENLKFKNTLNIISIVFMINQLICWFIWLTLYAFK